MWRGKRRPIANADRWVKLDVMLSARPDMVLAKAKAHCTQKDAHNGLIYPLDLMGNAAADAVAVAGVESACGWMATACEGKQGSCL